MIVLTGYLRFDPEALPRLREAMAAVIAATRGEDGCLHYSYGEDVLEPGVIRLQEQWRDQAALDAHFAAPHMRAWQQARAEAGGLLERRVQVHHVSASEDR